uniref:F-box domain-containing protein n=1 Tax=Aegilops tauschii subsp. strangulata TaxID=200361 RepID=A0A453MFK9_AEGTS
AVGFPSAAPAPKFPHRKPSPHRPTMPPPPASALPDELLEEVFFRLPPDEPEHLLRASLVSKVWLGLLSAPRFRPRYRDFHGAPPMLGILSSRRSNSVDEVEDNIPHFIPTTKFRVRIPGDTWGDWRYAARDCRHGRVLLGNETYQPVPLVVWDPMTGRRRELDPPFLVGGAHGYGAAVLCAVAGCDHRACHAGPFQVAFVGVDKIKDGEFFASACVSSPVTGDWSKPCHYSHYDEWSEPCSRLHLGSNSFWAEMPPVFVQGALYFKFMSQEDDHIAILKYDLGSNCLSLIDAPLAGSVLLNATILMAMDYNSLGFAHVDKFTLHLWSRQRGSDKIASWAQRSVINLDNLLPIQNPNKRFRLIGSVEGSDIIFVTMGLHIYEISLKTLRWKKLQKREKLCDLIPYMSFYNPQGIFVYISPLICDSGTTLK